MRALLMAEALLTLDGTAIPMGITAQAAVVGGMRDDYCDVTEAFLLEFIIRRLGDVTTRDHTALAHALFRQFDPRVSRDELEDRVVILLARLADHVVLLGDAYGERERDTA
jgi:NhaP-type Na+/H+ or K+/H+ antiporter